MKSLRIGNGAGFFGDQLDAPRRLVQQDTLDVLTLEYLAELTMSILAAQRRKSPDAGYARDLLTVMQSLHPALHQQPQLHIVTNGGGVNPLGCTRAVARQLVDAGLASLPLGMIAGDDLTERLPELLAGGCPLAHLDTGQPLAELLSGGVQVAAAHAYLGARGIAECLHDGARIVITGRVADASLTLGPAVWRCGWAWDAWKLLAAASVAGHLIECGAQVTGGYSLRSDLSALALEDIGYPIAVIDELGEVEITKPAGTGGRVDRLSVIEQLVYEIGDPENYVTPDVVVDFTSVTVEELAADRVRVRTARGKPAPDMLKVSLAYANGFTSAATLVVAGRGCTDRARQCADIVYSRLKRAGCIPAGWHVELLGTGASLPVEQRANVEPYELVLRIAVSDARREVVERFTHEIAPLITSGPAGLAGYAVARSPVRPVLAYWPTLVPRDLVPIHCETRTAAQWSIGP